MIILKRINHFVNSSIRRDVPLRRHQLLLVAGSPIWSLLGNTLMAVERRTGTSDFLKMYPQSFVFYTYCHQRYLGHFSESRRLATPSPLNEYTNGHPMAFLGDGQDQRDLHVMPRGKR